MKLAEFVRLYPLRSRNIAWLFGAGTSVSAGMPTAGDLIWDFKRMIYCTEEKIQITLLNNLSDLAVRNQIQSYFDSKQGFPAYNSIEEYSFYFEQAYPTASDRSRFLMERLKTMQTSYGHKAIGILMKNGLLPIIFTTNFDKAFENAAVDQFKVLDNFLTATLENTDTAIQKFNQGFRPIIVKLHGDYFSEKLKNTSTELQAQDQKLRQVLYNACLTSGLAVMGYSGRDESVMQVILDAIEQRGALTNGLFWFNRAGSKPLPEVEHLIQAATNKGIQAELVEIETFDTAWADIVRGFPNLPLEDIAALNENYFRTAPSAVAPNGKNYPVIRLNAIRIEEYPTNARLIKCEAGNTREIKSLVEQKNVDVICLRKKNGVVGFGADSDFDTLLSIYGKMEKDVYTITDRMLMDEDSTIKGMITEALIKALCNNRPLKSNKRRDSHFIYPDPKKINDGIFSSLKTELPTLIGRIPGSQSHWIVALEISIQVKFSKPLLVCKPTIFTSKSPVVTDRFINAAYVKEAMARWYNNKFQSLLDAWIAIVFQGHQTVEFSAYGKDLQGFNPKFKLSKEAVFSKTN